MVIAPHVAAVPGLATFGLITGLNLLGDGVRDAIDAKGAIWL